MKKNNKLTYLFLIWLIGVFYLILSTISIIDAVLTKDWGTSDLTKILFCFFIGVFTTTFYGAVIIAKIKIHERNKF
jgi:hypothetical protein